MADLTETINWEEGIYRIETTDPVIGGESGISNIQAKQLGNRTLYLKDVLDTIDVAGDIKVFAMDTAPTGFLKCNGAIVSRTTYARLFSAIGETFGAGDGSTTFQIPDLRAEFIRGWDNGRGVDSGRDFGSAQSEMVGTHNHRVKSVLSTAGNSNYPLYSNMGNTSVSNTPDGTTADNTGTENRPRNIALLYCIRY